MRRYYTKIIDALAATIVEDHDQIKYPGSRPVYGTETSDGRLELTEGALEKIARHEGSIALIDMQNELTGCGCSSVTCTVACRMLRSIIFDQEQEDAIRQFTNA